MGGHAYVRGQAMGCARFARSVPRGYWAMGCVDPRRDLRGCGCRRQPGAQKPDRLCRGRLRIGLGQDFGGDVTVVADVGEDPEDLVERHVAPARRQPVAVGHVNVADVVLRRIRTPRRNEASSMFMWNRSGISLTQARPASLDQLQPFGAVVDEIDFVAIDGFDDQLDAQRLGHVRAAIEARQIARFGRLAMSRLRESSRAPGRY